MRRYQFIISALVIGGLAYSTPSPLAQQAAPLEGQLADCQAGLRASQGKLVSEFQADLDFRTTTAKEQDGTSGQIKSYLARIDVLQTEVAKLTEENARLKKGAAPAPK